MIGKKIFYSRRQGCRQCQFLEEFLVSILSSYLIKASCLRMRFHPAAGVKQRGGANYSAFIHCPRSKLYCFSCSFVYIFWFVDDYFEVVLAISFVIGR